MSTAIALALLVLAGAVLCLGRRGSQPNVPHANSTPMPSEETPHA